MQLSRKKFRQYLASRLKTFGAIVLLVLYIAGNNQFESFHQLIHEHAVVVHNADNEKNPCHRTIYHLAKEEGCKHKVHLTDDRKCPLCHLVTSADQLITYLNESSLFLASNVKSHAAAISVVENCCPLLPARAPPVA